MFAKLLCDHSNRQEQIRIVRYDHSKLVIIPKAIHQQMGGYIYIGAFFLRFDNFDITTADRRARHGHFVGKKCAKNNFEIGNGLKGAQEGALTERLVGVVRARLDFRGKVFDPPNVVFWQQKAAHLRHIQPFIGCALDTSIVEVETVNVDVCFHKSLNTETAVRRPRTGFANYYRGICLYYHQNERGCQAKIRCNCEDALYLKQSPVMQADCFIVRNDILMRFHRFYDGTLAAAGVHFWTDVVFHVMWGVIYNAPGHKLRLFTLWEAQFVTVKGIAIRFRSPRNPHAHFML